MMSDKKLSTIRAELRRAFAEGGVNPIAALDQKIRELSKKAKGAKRRSKALELLRDTLAQVIEEKPSRRGRSSRTNRSRKAV